jgi:hypothetical protein
MPPRKPDLKKLKTHFLGGCNFAAKQLEPVARLTKWENPSTDYWCWDSVPATTDDLRLVTCGYCKTKLLNQLWFKDWSLLTEQELSLLTVLRADRDLRKSQET